VTPEDRAAHCRQMATDYLARADQTRDMIARHPDAAECPKWSRGEKADRKRAAQMIRRAERAETEDISRVIA
jgi:hypothetical protein